MSLRGAKRRSNLTGGGLTFSFFYCPSPIASRPIFLTTRLTQDFHRNVIASERSERGNLTGGEDNIFFYPFPITPCPSPHYFFTLSFINYKTDPTSLLRLSLRVPLPATSNAWQSHLIRCFLIITTETTETHRR